MDLSDRNDARYTDFTTSVVQHQKFQVSHALSYRNYQKLDFLDLFNIPGIVTNYYLGKVLLLKFVNYKVVFVTIHITSKHFKSFQILRRHIYQYDI